MRTDSAPGSGRRGGCEELGGEPLLDECAVVLDEVDDLGEPAGLAFLPSDDEAWVGLAIDSPDPAVGAGWRGQRDKVLVPSPGSACHAASISRYRKSVRVNSATSAPALDADVEPWRAPDERP